MKLLAIATACTLLAVSASGQLSVRWSARFPETSWPQASSVVDAIADAGQGEFLSLSSGSNGTQYVSRVRKHAASGVVRWELLPVPFGARLTQLHSDGAGGAIATGHHDLPGLYTTPDSILALRLDSSGALAWSDTWNPGTFLFPADAALATLAHDGSLWQAGTLEQRQRLYVRRLSPQGSVLVQVHWPLGPETFVRALLALPDGGLAVAGERDRRLFVRTFDAQGQPRWSDELVLGSSPYDSRYSALAFEPRSGRIAACGTLFQYGSQQQGLIRILASDGAVVRSEHLWAAFGVATRLDSVVATSDGRLVFGGARELALGAGVKGSLIVGDDSAGNRLFVRTPSNPASAQCERTFLSAGRAGQVHSLRWFVHTTWLNSGALDEWDVAGNATSSLPLAPSGLSLYYRCLGAVEGGLLLGGGNSLAGDNHASIALVGTRTSPDGFCEGQASSAGCEPTLAFEGRASASAAANFRVRALQMPSETRAVLFFGTDGAVNEPLGGGTRCVAGPLQRTGMRSTGTAGSGSSSCRGTLDVNLAALALVQPALSVPGTVVCVQAWARDSALPGGGVLSSAWRFTTLP